MNENSTQAASSPNQICANLDCAKPLLEGWEYCPFCGTKTVPSSTTSTIDTYIEHKINSELLSRLKDQNSLVREIGDKAEDIVWRRFFGYFAIIAVLLAVIAFFGIKSFGDLATPIEQRVQTVQRRIEEVEKKVAPVRAALDQLSDAVDAQTKRVAEKSGAVTQKLEGLDATANDAQKRVATYQARAEELSSRLDAMEKSLENKVEQVSKQVDTISVRQAYPALGQQKFVTFQFQQWKGKAAKNPNEKWVNICISGDSIGNFSPDQIERLVADLKKVRIYALGGHVWCWRPLFYQPQFVRRRRQDGRVLLRWQCRENGIRSAGYSVKNSVNGS